MVMKKILKTTTFLTIFLIAIFAMMFAWLEQSLKIIDTEEEKFKFNVTEGENINNIIKRLEDENFIKSYIAFRIYSFIQNIPLNFKFGEYELKKNNDIKEIINVLNTGTIRKGIMITIKEGLRDDQIIDILMGKFPNLMRENFENIIKNPANLTDIDNFNNIINQKYGISGMLFPDTYEFDINAKESDIVLTMFDNFVSKTKPYKSKPDFYNKLILASIVERESSREDDPKLIASVFINRLNNKMLLQSDATVNFITKKNDPSVLISDILIDNPYNTYKYLGLPPSPICNPGLRSIDAAFTDLQSEWFYFFHHNNKTYFSKTFAEHNQKLQQLGLL